MTRAKAAFSVSGISRKTQAQLILWDQTNLYCHCCSHWWHFVSPWSAVKAKPDCV